MALATVADLMPLAGENRRLVREGLTALANTAKPGLRALMQVSRCDPSGLGTYDLGFRLAPRINAAGRLRRADSGLELLLTEDPSRAAEIAAELDAVNVERRAVEQRILWEADAQVRELGERPAYVLAAEDWHPGVIGIVASRIVERYHRPTVLVALDGDSGTGSGRSIPGFDLLGALHAVAGELERYGGHRAAAGLTVRTERVEALRAGIEAHAAARAHRGSADAGRARGRDRVRRRARARPGRGAGRARADCGMGNARCRLLVPGARFEDVRPMGEGRHARFSVHSAGARARAVAFGCDGSPGPVGEPLDCTFRLERNVWNGAVEPRLVLGQARACAPGAIEVVGEHAEYLAAVLGELDAVLERVGRGRRGGRADARSPRRQSARRAGRRLRGRRRRCSPCAPTSRAGCPG